MKEKIKHYIKEIFLLILVVTVFANIISIYKSRDLSATPLKFSSLELSNGKTYSFPSDKPILIYFWATWCPVCKLQAPNIEFISKHFEVVTIAEDSGTTKELNAYLKKQGNNYKVVNDSMKHISSAFNVVGFPTIFIYDKNKKLAFSEVGYTSIIGLYLRMWWAGLN